MNRYLAQAIRCVLVQLDGTPSSMSRLALARQVALRADARLFAMFVASPPQWPPQLALSETPGEPLKTVDRAAFGRARSLFDNAAAAGGPAMLWLDSNGVDAVQAFRRAAMYADLLVLGQHDGTAGSGLATEPGFAESTLIDTGRPALIVPRTGHFDDIGQDVLVGWTSAPQAVRALGAALPWLRAARQVHVLEAASASSQSDDNELSIAQHLRRHAIQCTLHHDRRSDANAGETLLSLAGEVDADLLVMGCYGHSRARELVLGGATRTVLEAARLPVLMTH